MYIITDIGRETYTEWVNEWMSKQGIHKERESVHSPFNYMYIILNES